MTWQDGRPIYNRLPLKGYQDNLVADWLTLWVDEKLSGTASTLEAFWQNLIPETCPAVYLDYLGYLCGLSGQYWDTKWSTAVKRLMVANTHKFWSDRGTMLTIKSVLDIHRLTYTLWTNGALRLPFTLPNTFGTDDLRLYVRLPLIFQRTSQQFKEAQRTLRNYAPAVVKSAACFERFYLGFSYFSDPLFTN